MTPTTSTHSSEQRARLSLLLSLLAFVAGGAIGIALGPEPVFPDSRDYLEIAQSLRDDGIFADRTGHINSRPPLFPAALALLPKLPWARLISAAAFALLVDRSGRWTDRWLGAKAGLALRASLCFNPLLLVFSGLLLTEMLFALFLVYSLERWDSLGQRPSRKTTLKAGLSWAAAMLTRPSGAILAVFFLASAVRRRRLKEGVLFFLAASLPLFPWALRNELALGVFSPFPSKAGSDLYEVMGEHADGGPMKDRIDWPGELASMGEARADAHLFRLATAWMLAHPVEVLELAAKKQRRFWSPLPNAPSLQGTWIQLGSGLFYVPWLLMALLGASLALRRHLPTARVLGPILLFAALHAIFMGSIRYRVPIEPLLGMLVVGLFVKKTGQKR